MPLTVAELVATLGLDARGFERGLGQIGSLLTSAGIIAGLNKVEQAASDLQQAAGGTAAVFGDMAHVIDAAAKDSAESMGLSERQFRESTSRIGALLKGMGYDTRAAADESIRLTQVGADLAATFGGTTAEAVDALAAALRGETDPIERYGISLRQADVDARAMAMGLAATSSEVDANAKAQASLAIITEKSGGALGQFAREAESAAGQAQISSAKMENAQANMGEALLPIYAKISSAVGSLADFFGGLPEPAQTAIIAIAGIAAIASPVNQAVKLVGTLADALTNAAANGSSAAAAALRVGPALAAAGIAAAGAAVSLALWNRALAEGEERAGKFGDLVGSQLSGASSLDEFNGLLQGTRDRIADIDRTLDGSSAPWDADYRGELEAGRDAAQGQADAYERMVPVIEALTRQTGDADAATRTVLGSYEAVTRALEDGYTPAQAAAVAVNEKNAAATAASQAVTDAFGNAVDDSAAALEEQQKAIAEVVDQLGEYFEEAFAAQDAVAAWEGALDDLTESIDENGASLDLSTEKGRANFEAGRDVAEGLLRLMQRRFEETGSIEAATAAGELYVEQLRNQLREAGLTEEQVQAFVDTLHLVPGDYAAHVTADTGQAETALGRLLGQIAALSGGTHEITFHAGPGGGPRAAGGRVEAGVPRPVGEMGVEWFVPDTAGTIVNAHQVRQAEAAAAGGGGTTIEQLNVYTSDSPRQWIDEGLWRVAG